MADNGWGPAPHHEAISAQATDAFDTAELQDAIPSSGSNGDVTSKPEPPAGWVKATPYDYAAYGNDGGNQWEGSARVYEWDGEQGDIGPEFPALEIELFGDPTKRVNEGIDFSK
jgi:ATP-dependent RNA helicase DDX3X